MFESDEKVLCTIEGEITGKKFKGDRAAVTDRRIYKTGMNRLGREHKKVVSLDCVSAAEWTQERFLRFPVIGLLFLFLCCLMSAYFIPGGKTLRLILGIVVIGIGAAVMIACTVVYFKFKIRTITVYFAGGKLRIASQGISDDDAEEFVNQVLIAAAEVRKANVTI